MVAGDQFRLAFRQIERDPFGLRNRGGKEKQERQRLQENAPGRQPADRGLEKPPADSGNISRSEVLGRARSPAAPGCRKPSGRRYGRKAHGDLVGDHLRRAAHSTQQGKLLFDAQAPMTMP